MKELWYVLPSESVGCSSWERSRAKAVFCHDVTAGHFNQRGKGAIPGDWCLRPAVIVSQRLFSRVYVITELLIPDILCA